MEVAETQAPVVNGFVNPLTLEDCGDRLDTAINALIATAVGTVEDEIQYAMKRRSVAAAVRGIRVAKLQLDSITEEDAAMGIVPLLIAGFEVDLKRMFKQLNPASPDTVITDVVTTFLAPYRSEVPKQSKSRKPK